jgi:hypothetical protein
MKTIKTQIIPSHQTIVKVKGEKHHLDYKAICIFSAFGFFLDTDTYWKDEKVLSPATINTINDDGYLIDSKPWFQWYYKPKELSLKQATESFQELFENIVHEQSDGRDIILPLSGGLDSRSQAISLKKSKVNVKSYSYSFQNGFKESGISKKIAKACDFPFKEFTIEEGYLWDKVEKLASINKCYSEFTHPRQMAVIDEVAELGNSFSLGHWGDVLFDSDGLAENVSDIELVQILKKKVLKKGGLELALSLWKSWGIEGEFEQYLEHRLIELLSKIEIKNVNAKVRAFKSLYWAPRWTSVNLSVFENKHPILLPYYEDRMCQFICEVPEELLANRQIQIEYIKQNNKEVASIVWQDAKPFNLYNYHLAKAPYNIPYRIIDKLKREFRTLLGKTFVQRNWELQFLGKENRQQLEKHLYFKNFLQFVDKSIVDAYFNLFDTKDKVYYSHSVSTLLTLSLFTKQLNEK